MFEPDGRNSLQTLGHGALSVARVLVTVFGVIAVFPTMLFLISQRKLQIQQATINALNDPGPRAALVVDFNEATLGAYDGRIAQAWMSTGQPGPNPNTRTLPFQVTLVYRRGNLWEPEEDPEVNQRTRWVYYNLPFGEKFVVDSYFNYGIDANVWRVGQDDPEVLEPLAHVLAKRDSLGIDAAYVRSDPWWASGAFKLAQTKNWDWHSGFELVHAKAAANYRAYVAAARVVARMRHYAACKAIEVPFPFNAGWNHATLPGNLVAKAGRRGDDFARAYRSAFKGGLPVVLLHLQSLTAKSLDHDDNWKRFKAQYGPDLEHNAEVGLRSPADTPFVTGMHLWTGYHAYDAQKGRPIFTYSDFLVRSTPAINDDAREAQRALLQLLEDEFWFKFFPREDHQWVHAILEEERIQFGRDVHFSRMFGHRAYHCLDSK